MNRKDVDEFEKLSVQLQSIYDELSILSKKSPNDAVNKFKLNFINKLLNNSNELLSQNIDLLMTFQSLIQMTYHNTVM